MELHFRALPVKRRAPEFAESPMHYSGVRIKPQVYLELARSGGTITPTKCLSKNSPGIAGSRQNFPHTMEALMENPTGVDCSTRTVQGHVRQYDRTLDSLHAAHRNLNCITPP